ncbi:MAG: hypothetical protein KF774_21335 [Planctomyces sp.]|nr:hypothetical protein [Planctomyces sp.]
MSARRLVSAALASAALLVPGIAPAQEAPSDDGRIVAVLANSQELIDDLRFIVADLAGAKSAWEDDVFPNIDVFLFGVDKQEPVGADVVFDADSGRRLVLHIPVDDRPVFISDNLNAADIITKLVRGQRDLYQLSGVFEGWMRFTQPSGMPRYASISTKPEDIPEGMPSPKKKYTPILAAGGDAAVRWFATAENAGKREKGFETLKQNLLEAVKKRPDESQAAFELRRLAVEQQADRLSRLLTNTASLSADWRTDVRARKYGGASSIAGLPGTQLAAAIASIGSEESRFARIADGAGAVLTSRVLLPVTEDYRTDQKRLYDAWLASWSETVDRKEGPTPDEKAARKQLAEHVVQLLSDSLQLEWLDTFAEIAPSEGDLYTALIAVRVHDSSLVLPILEILPQVQQGWQVELNAFEEQGVAVHRLELQEKSPKSLTEFFGESGILYVATGEQTLWVAGGLNAETSLRSAISSAAAAGGRPASADPVQVSMRVRPALRFIKTLLEDEDIQFVRSLNQSRLLKNTERKEDAESDEEDSSRRVSRDALKDFAWQDAALEGLSEGNDSLRLHVRKDGEALLGEMDVEEGVIRAVGFVVVEFAKLLR